MHWLFGDQLGPHFLTPGQDGPGRNDPLLMIEARSVFRRRRFHRAKAHLVLSAMRHRAAAGEVLGKGGLGLHRRRVVDVDLVERDALGTQGGSEDSAHQEAAQRHGPPRPSAQAAKSAIGTRKPRAGPSRTCGIARTSRSAPYEVG